MAVAGPQLEPVDPLELFDLFHGVRRKRRLTLKGVQHDAFEQVAKGDVFEFGQALKNFQDALLDTYSGLYPFDLQPVSSLRLHGTNIPWYQNYVNFRRSRKRSSTLFTFLRSNLALFCQV